MQFPFVMQVCSWSSSSSVRRNFILGTQLRLDNHSRLHQTGVSVQGTNGLRTITGALFVTCSVGVCTFIAKIVEDFLSMLRT